jgi:hypothetical protein
VSNPSESEAVLRQLALLKSIYSQALAGAALNGLAADQRNARGDIGGRLRERERKHIFGEEFLAAARAFFKAAIVR